MSQTKTDPLKRPLIRSGIRRRIAGITVSVAMTRQMIKTIHLLQQENAWLRNKLGS